MKNCFLPIFLAVVGLGSCAATSENGQVASEESLTDVLYQCVDSITIEQGVPRVENEEENETEEWSDERTDEISENEGGDDGWKGFEDDDVPQERPIIKDDIDIRKIREKVREAKKFVAQNGMNQDWCLLLDFSYDLYTRRLIVYDLKSNEIIRRELVSHGNGGGSTPSKPVFSNVEGSFCSSLGKYKIGKRAYSNWGIHVHYKLHGLEPTNSNAFRRIIVLHSYASAYCDYPTTASNGCPIVCDDVMRYLDEKLKQTTKPTLLWIFE
ncbi:MAG: murein L,D-transpeptidase catalytic domain family protein [Paludibacteraceae bacterium]|nr:murein L,D-transpeptidase catalytic domain family protein [Paludibacteraceae bacterium]